MKALKNESNNIRTQLKQHWKRDEEKINYKTETKVAIKIETNLFKL